jgi:hypothetical protein
MQMSDWREVPGTRDMPELQYTLSTGLWEILQGHSQSTRESLGHVVSKALAAYFDISHHTIYQVSTVTALAEGIYEAAVRVGVVRHPEGICGSGEYSKHARNGSARSGHLVYCERIRMRWCTGQNKGKNSKKAFAAALKSRWTHSHCDSNQTGASPLGCLVTEVKTAFGSNDCI